MGQSGYNTADRDEGIRQSITPYRVSLYQPTPTTGVVLAQDTDNKVNITVIPPSGVNPNGFDLFTTLEGPAIRFIGSGLGNGDVGVFRVSFQMSLEASTSAANFAFRLKTRPYTETSFANATVIEGCFVSADVAINKEGIYIVNSPMFTLSDGDLLELAIDPDSGVTVDINSLAVTAMEEY